MNTFERSIALRQELTDALETNMVLYEHMKNNFLRVDSDQRIGVLKSKLITHLTKIGEMLEIIKSSEAEKY